MLWPVFLLASGAWGLAAPRGIVEPPAACRNTYWCVRHGQSTANVANVISSDPVVGSTTHELTELGKDQARDAGAALYDALAARSPTEAPDLERVALYSSNFTRARETSASRVARYACSGRKRPGPGAGRTSWRSRSSAAVN